MSVGVSQMKSVNKQQLFGLIIGVELSRVYRLTKCQKVLSVRICLRKMLSRRRGIKLFCRHSNILRRLKAKKQAQYHHLMRQLQFNKKDEDYAELDTFHRAIKPCMFLVQLFGIMPLTNVLCSNPHGIGFNKLSLSMGISAFFMFLGGLRVLHYTGITIQVGLNTKNIVGFVYFWSGLTITINFIALARRWPKLIRHWMRIDLLMILPPYRPTRITLRRKIRLFVSCFFIIAFFEHLLYHASNFQNIRMRSEICDPNVTAFTLHDYIVDQVDLFPFNTVSAFCSFYTTAGFNIIWNYLDLFIMLVSIALAARFQQFADRVLQLVGHFVPDTLWHDIRQDHIALCEFMQHVDSNMSNVILISSLNNTFFICFQLLNIFTKLRYPINYVYFWVSLIFLLTRTSCVFMFASKIHDASLLPLKALYMVPSDKWTEEVQRFMFQLTTECIGLSGHRFFYVTRKGLFGLASAIVTYEFMLLQLDAKKEKMGLPDICA